MMIVIKKMLNIKKLTLNHKKTSLVSRMSFYSSSSSSSNDSQKLIENLKSMEITLNKKIVKKTYSKKQVYTFYYIVDKKGFDLNTEIIYLKNYFIDVIKTYNMINPYVINIKIIMDLNCKKTLLKSYEAHFLEFERLINNASQVLKNLRRFKEYELMQENMNKLKEKIFCISSTYNFDANCISDFTEIETRIENLFKTILKTLPNEGTNIKYIVSVKMINKIILNDYDIIINDTFQSLSEKIKQAKIQYFTRFKKESLDFENLLKIDHNEI